MSAPAARQPSAPLFWAFIVLMLVAIAVFVMLGTWQMQRLAEKEALIARVEARLDLPPAPVPPAESWPALDVAEVDFLPVALTGRFVAEDTVRVFTSLPSATARGAFSGPGYWFVTPFALEAGGTVFVNRGFVPEGRAAEPPPEGVVTVTGLAREPEPAGAFTPEANAAERLDWVRDPERLRRFADPALAPFAPFTVDRFAGPGGSLPQGGETVVEFPNNHLGYALTWYGFAVITPVMLGFWIWRQRRRPGGER